MRLGLIGLGRISAFHANTLGVPAVDTLVVTDIVPGKPQPIVAFLASAAPQTVLKLRTLPAAP